VAAPRAALAVWWVLEGVVGALLLVAGSWGLQQGVRHTGQAEQAAAMARCTCWEGVVEVDATCRGPPAMAADLVVAGACWLLWTWAWHRKHRVIHDTIQVDVSAWRIHRMHGSDSIVSPLVAPSAARAAASETAKTPGSIMNALRPAELLLWLAATST
jgi:hypothetical protein